MEIGGLYLVQPARLTSDSQDHTILSCIRQILRLNGGVAMKIFPFEQGMRDFSHKQSVNGRRGQFVHSPVDFSRERLYSDAGSC